MPRRGPCTVLTALPGPALQKTLKEMFPIESGDINAENRIIPHLPGEGHSAGGRGWDRNCSWLGKSPPALLCGCPCAGARCNFCSCLLGLKPKPQQGLPERWLLPPAEAGHRPHPSSLIARTSGTCKRESGFGQPQLSRALLRCHHPLDGFLCPYCTRGREAVSVCSRRGSNSIQRAGGLYPGKARFSKHPSFLEFPASNGARRSMKNSHGL